MRVTPPCFGNFKRTTKDTSFRGFEMCCVEDVVCWNAMIDGYVKYSEMELAKLVFERMVCRDVVSWNTMINGYALVGSIKEAKRLFDEMPRKKCGLLEFYVGGGALDQGASLHAYISEHKIGLTTIVGTALVDISSTFKEMQEVGVCPDDITFVVRLSACSHAGMVDEGRRFLACMSNLYGIDPKVEHYGCVIDLLSRAGLLVEAVECREKCPWSQIPVSGEHCLEVAGSMGTSRSVNLWENTVSTSNLTIVVAILANSSDADNVGSDDIVSFEGIESREKISESYQSCELIQTAAHADTFVKEEI
ncbi:hypothetical protein IFM89_039989 [Coptis chinensis]|uniref:Pentatricopeptide repeat-containing protein n=1 Tax=Coptis chinensis TaxID=261450 RepID=A0A835L9B5_9MAGN|nr:hypothetical protein IFM89_039989 [Coptis chinensis]